MPNVAYIKPELKKLLPIYELVDDCVIGDFQVKTKKEKYLPRPNSTDTSSENLARYNAYLQRAIFYNVTNATYVGLIGQIFAKETQIDLPLELEFLKTNADGSGKGLEQLAKEGCGLLLENSRFGILTKFPEVNEELSSSQIEEMNIRPSLEIFESSKIINWRQINIGAEIVYSLIVLEDKSIVSDDGFEAKEKIFYKVLKLNEEGNYEIEIWETNSEVASRNSIFNLTNSTIPTDFLGKPLKRIPFEFCGSDNNDASPDIPVLYDIAIVNIGHYRNSADYEESCFITGQPTPYFAGLSEEWVKNVLKGTVQLGSRGAVPLPAGGSAGLLQAQANSMPLEAMKHKEEQFLSLGAKLISANGTQKTATEAGISNVKETSVLASVANNVSSAFLNSLKNCVKFVTNKPSNEIVFKLNTDFEITKMSPAERDQLLKEWTQGVISFAEYRNNLRNGQLLISDDNTALADMQKEAQNKVLNPPEPVNNQSGSKTVGN